MLRKFDNYDGVCFFNGLVFFSPVALLIRTQAGVSKSTFFLLQALLSIAIFLGEIPTGYITDKIGYKRSIILSQTLMLIARVLLLLAFCKSSMWLFVFEAVVEGVANCFSSGTNSAYLYSVFGEENFTGKSAHSANYGTAGFIISTISYAAIYKYQGIRGLLIATLMAGLVAEILSLFIVKETKIEGWKSTSISKIIGIMKNKKAGLYMSMLSLFSVSWILINFFFVEKLEDSGMSVEWMAGIILGYSAFQMLAEPLISRFDKQPARKMLTVTGVTGGLAMAVFGTISKAWLVLPAMIILPLLISLPEYYLMEEENRLVDALGMDDNRAASLSVLNMGVNVVEIMALFASALISGGGITCCFLVIGLLLVMCSLCNLRK